VLIPNKVNPRQTYTCILDDIKGTNMFLTIFKLKKYTFETDHIEIKVE